MTDAGSGAKACPLDPVLNLLAKKWLVHIVWILGRTASLRFAELQRQLPGKVSAKVLSARLKQLETLGVIERDDKGTNRPHVEYRLTFYGRRVEGFLQGVEDAARGVTLPIVGRAGISRTVAARARDGRIRK
jgi:DNA-binding HxlR family transcriptional regulator